MQINNITFNTHETVGELRKQLDVAVKIGDKDEEMVLSLEYSEAQGLKAKVYDNPNPMSAPVAFDLNGYFNKTVTNIPSITNDDMAKIDPNECRLFDTYEAAQKWYLADNDVLHYALNEDLPSYLPSNITLGDWLMIKSQQFYFTDDDQVLFVYK